MSGYGGYNPSAPPGGYNPSAPPGGYNPSAPPGGYNPSAPPGGYNPSAPPGGYNPQQTGYGQQMSAPGGYNQAGAGGYRAPAGGCGGYPTHPPQPDLQEIFTRVDKDRSGHISVNELQSALSNGTWQPFNPETIRLMISMFDKDGNGTINFHEFGALWKYIIDWQNTFRYYDRDNSGSIDQNELQTAITSFGFRLSSKFYGLLMRKFDRTGNQTITFDDFIQCCVLIQTLSAAFQRKDTNRNGWIQINYEEFMELVFSTKI